MPALNPLPRLYLLGDARNDAGLEEAIARLPAGSALVYRHYHLGEDARRARYDGLLPALRTSGHAMILAGPAEQASRWGADGCYGPADSLGPPSGLLRIATAHDAPEIAAADAVRADAVMLSPVFPTRSHPGARTLGRDRFRALAARSAIPVIALGGMNPARAAELDWPRWAAIDGLSWRPAV